MSLLTLMLGPIGRKCEQILVDFAAPISRLTELLLDVGQLFRRGVWLPLWLIPIVVPFLIPPLLGDRPTRKRTFAVVATLLSMLISAFLLLIAVVFLLLPMINLMNAVQGK
jgi:hypothetical protein